MLARTVPSTHTADVVRHESMWDYVAASSDWMPVYHGAGYTPMGLKQDM